MSSTKKNRFIVIGNGFDLSCGLESTYSAFFNHEKLREEYQISITKVKKQQNSRNENFVPIHSDRKQKDSDEITSLIMKKYSDQGFWMLYFLGELYTNGNKIGKNWMDIESLIKDFFNKPIGSYTSYFAALERNKDSHEPNHAVWQLDILEKVLKERNPQGCRTTMEFADLLIEELKRFERRFGIYIFNLQENNEDYGCNAIDLIEKLYEYPDNNLVGIDSFNYTDFIDHSRYSYLIRHIHGDVNHPIFGINIYASDSEAEDDPSYIFTKKSRQLEINRKDTELSFPDIDEVMIFGHSLNEQDQGYFQGLFDLLRIRDLSLNKPKLIFGYNVYGEHTETSARVEILKRVTNLFKRYEKDQHDNNVMQALIVAGRIEFKLIK